jgi:hypothetical protein
MHAMHAHAVILAIALATAAVVSASTSCTAPLVYMECGSACTPTCADPAPMCTMQVRAHRRHSLTRFPRVRTLLIRFYFYSSMRSPRGTVVASRSVVLLTSERLREGVCGLRGAVLAAGAFRNGASVCAHVCFVQCVERCACPFATPLWDAATNRCLTEAECGGAASPSSEACVAPKDAGPCKAMIPRFYFNAATGACEQFVYGGCGGNDNRFETMEACQAACA